LSEMFWDFFKITENPHTGEPANVVGGLFAVAAAIDRLTEAVAAQQPKKAKKEDHQDYPAVSDRRHAAIGLIQGLGNEP